MVPETQSEKRDREKLDLALAQATAAGFSLAGIIRRVHAITDTLRIMTADADNNKWEYYTAAMKILSDAADKLQHLQSKHRL